MTDRQTLDVYAKRGADYAAKFKTDRPDRQLAKFISALPGAAVVLDLGCGMGQSTAFMRDAGLQVEAWDASPEMAQLGRDAFGIDIVIATFGDLSAKSEYDGIFANFSLLHAPKSEMPDHLGRIAAALKPGGLLHLGLKMGEGQARDQLGRFYAYYQDGEITELLDAAGLDVESREFGADEGLAGTVSPWIILSVRRRE